MLPSTTIRAAQNNVLTGHTYRNPVKYVDNKIHTAPDPFILRYRDHYFCYATDEQGVLVSISTDLVHWETKGFCYREQGRQGYWAPSVILINGIFYLYVSNRPQGETDTHTEVMRVATSRNPLGPFDKKAQLFDTFAIDSQVVYGDDGHLYLLYADNQVSGLSDFRPGTSVMIDRLITPFARENKPRPLIVPTMDEEIFARNRFGDGRDWHTVEGATYFSYRDKAYITYSANAYEHEDYFVGYSSAHFPPDPMKRHIDELSWAKRSNGVIFDPLLIRSSSVEGTGHNSIIKAPNGIDDWIVYHGRSVGEKLHSDVEQRMMRIDPLYYAENGLDTPGPTSDLEDAPFDSTVSDNFASGYSSIWNVISGVASTVHDEQGNQLETNKNTIFSAITGEDSLTQVVDVWVKASVDPLGGRFGVIVSYQDLHNFALLEINAGLRSITVISKENDLITKKIISRNLYDIDVHEWHEYRIERAYQHLDLYIDNRFISSCNVTSLYGKTGLYSIRTQTDFSSFHATEHVNLWGSRLQDFYQEMVTQESFIVESGIHPLHISPAELVIKDPLQNNRFVLDLTLQSAEGYVNFKLGDYQLSITNSGVNLRCDKKTIHYISQPQRLREQNPGLQHDFFGCPIVTIRIEDFESNMRIHVRGKTWYVPLRGGDNHIEMTLNRASLTGYTRTRLKSLLGERNKE